MSRSVLFLATITFFACTSMERAPTSTLLNWMSGTFSSAAQAAADSNYSDVRFEMVPIWTDRTDGPWLYVEQASASNPDRPYRQRVYQLVGRRDGTIESIVYTLPGSHRYAGAWKEPNPLGDLSPDSLAIREGCSVILLWHDGFYSGGTHEKDCASAHRSASYTTSEVRVYEDRLETWVRGFDENDQQVWGAATGPYVFERSVTEG